MARLPADRPKVNCPRTATAITPARLCRRGVRRSESGGPHAGSASGKGVVGWRYARAARNSPDGVPIRQASASQCTRRLATSPAPLQGPPSGLPRPQFGRTAGDALGAHSGTDLDAKYAMSATGPDRCPAPARRQESRTRPGGWLAQQSLRKARRQRNRVGPRLLP
ncbi:hypothetical protein IMCC20628_01256 [Hoeflea sp. IMCC20628]|nr:hypothetical protein IMCC20628_01256 [Hoeflea sp. IMCC20628]